jgi:RNA polymerase sigma-70 factor (ECF subfamily)
VPGAVWSLRGTPQVVFAFTVEDGVVTAIDLLAAPETVAALDLQPLRQR